NTAIFSVVNTVLLRPLPFPNSERIVYMGEWSQQIPEMSVSYPNFLDWRDQNQVFDGLAAFRNTNYVLTGGGEPERLAGRQVSSAFFPVLGVAPVVGRNFTPDEDKPGGSPVALISHGFWQRRLGGDPSILNKPLLLNGESYTVIGVLPQTFELEAPVDVFVTVGLHSDRLMERDSHPGMYVLGLLKPGVSVEQAYTEMKTIAARLADKYPQSNAGNSVALQSLQDQAVKEIKRPLWLLFWAVVLVLLIACANVANLLLARAASRSKEIAIRTALGAGRLRIMRQLLTESLLLSLLGGLLGLLFAMWGIDALLAALPDDIPRLLTANIGLDKWVLLFTFGISVLTGLLFGLAPALQASKSNLNDSLKEGGRSGSAGGSHQSVRNALVVSEVALSLLLLVGAGLLIQSFMRLQQTDLGFDPQNVLTLRVPLPEARYKENAQVASFWDELENRVRVLPGVESVGTTRGLPMKGGIESGITVEGQEVANNKDIAMAVNLFASANYFRTMNIPLVSGRYFTEQDTKDSQPVVLVDEMLVARFFPNTDPVGKRLKMGGVDSKSPWLQVVGVVKHVKHYSPNEEGRVEIYTPYKQVPEAFFAASTRGMWLAVKTKADPTSLTAAIRNEVQQIDKDQPISNVDTMENIVAGTVAPQKFATWLLGIFAATAMLLAAIGIYGVMAYSVTQRTHEIGIRMALGAGQKDVLRMVIGQGMKLALIGVALGLAGSFAATHLMSSLLYGVSATDPLTYGGVALLLAAVALFACLIPARRATKVDPMIALRYE
ncbi:MAG TPA: ABC transporter permease, partial [Pyrinomonadaceae bacterium]|nr:ABC transporter permease [Pyrinomonadaceae bacterium]